MHMHMPMHLHLHTYTHTPLVSVSVLQTPTAMKCAPRPAPPPAAHTRGRRPQPEGPRCRHTEGTSLLAGSDASCWGFCVQLCRVPHRVRVRPCSAGKTSMMRRVSGLFKLPNLFGVVLYKATFLGEPVTNLAWSKMP